MPEPEEAYLRAVRQRMARESGSGLDTRRFGLVAPSPEWEQSVASLPAYPDPDGPLQDAEGRFYFMAGLGALGLDPLQ
jgi:hypothetical protein